MIPAFGSREARPDEVPQSGPRILIVDDAAPIVRTLREILQRLGHPKDEIAHATTPEEALRWFNGHCPGVAFVEFIGVHNEDGLEIIHEMLERAPDAKIVLLTAEGRDCPEVRAALRAGIFAHLEKPLRLEKVRQVMQDLAAEEGNIVRYK